jgi:hypothetical protein
MVSVPHTPQADDAAVMPPYLAPTVRRAGTRNVTVTTLSSCSGVRSMSVQ